MKAYDDLLTLDNLLVNFFFDLSTETTSCNEPQYQILCNLFK